MLSIVIVRYLINALSLFVSGYHICLKCDRGFSILMYSALLKGREGPYPSAETIVSSPPPHYFPPFPRRRHYFPPLPEDALAIFPPSRGGIHPPSQMLPRTRSVQEEAKLTLLQQGAFLGIKNIPAPADSKGERGG